MKTATLAILSGMILLGASLQAQAENQWSKYQGVDSKKYQHKPSYPQNSAQYSNNLQHHRPILNHSHARIHLAHDRIILQLSKMA